MIRSIAGPAPGPLDRLGVVLTCGGLACLTYTADLLSQPRTDWALVGVLAVVTAAALGAGVAHLRRTPAPLLNLRTLRIPTFGAAIGASSFFWLVVGSVPFLLPLLFQTVFLWDPVKSGAVVLFLFAGNVGIKVCTTFLLNRFGFRRVLLFATASVAVTVLAAAFLVAATPIAVIALVVLLGGVARSIGLSSYAAMAFSDVPIEQMRDANTIQATNMQLASGLGIAFSTVLLHAGGPIGRLLGGHPGPHAPFTVAFVLLAVVAVVPFAWALRLHPTAGDAIRHGATQPAAG
jgi:hypothetical protein